MPVGAQISMLHDNLSIALHDVNHVTILVGNSEAVDGSGV